MLHGSCEAKAELETHNLMHNKHILARIYDVSKNLPACSAAVTKHDTADDRRGPGCMGAAVKIKIRFVALDIRYPEILKY